jgi:hypothetical protein
MKWLRPVGVVLFWLLAPPAAVIAGVWCGYAMAGCI